MTVKQAAQQLQVCSGSVYGLLLAGKLKCYRIGSGRGVYRISDEHLREYLAAAERGVVAEKSPPARRVGLKHLRRASPGTSSG